jgi:hypothetical protein
MQQLQQSQAGGYVQHLLSRGPGGIASGLGASEAQQLLQQLYGQQQQHESPHRRGEAQLQQLLVEQIQVRAYVYVCTYMHACV